MRFYYTLILLLSVLQSYAFSAGGLNYSISEGQATVTGAVDKNLTTIVIPATVTYGGKTYEVTTVGRDAFHNCVNATTLIIEDSDTPIKSVWYKDSNGWQVQSLPFKNSPLTDVYVGRNTSVYYTNSIAFELPLTNSGTEVNVTFSGKANQINMTTFRDVNLASITLGGSIQNVYKSTFSGQTNLRKVVLEAADTDLNFAEGDAFPDCPLDSVIAYRACAKQRANSAANGFYNNEKIRHIVCGSPVVNRQTFYCKSIESFRILPSCRRIETQAIGNPWSNIKNIFIDDCEQPLEGEFTYDLLDSLYIGREMPTDFSRSFRAKKIQTGPLLTSIADFLFYGHNEAEVINLHENVQSIGERSFYDCDNLTSMHLPESISNIGKEAFCGCSKLESINIPSSLTAIPESMLEGCKMLHGSLIIRPHIKSIGRRAFNDCGFSELIIEDSDETLSFLETSPIYGTKFDYVYFGRQPVKNSSGYSVLHGEIDTLELGPNVKDIIYNFGIGDGKVKHLILSENISKIRHFMFSGCSNLQTITCKNALPAVTEGTDDPRLSAENFANVVVTVPVGAKRAYQADKTWGKFRHIRCDEYIIRSSYDSEMGSVTLNGENTAEIRIKEGASLRLVADPAPEYVFESIAVDGIPAQAVAGVYEIPEVNDDHDISVVFDKYHTGLEEVPDNVPIISVSAGNLTVTGCANGCSVYDINGWVVYSGQGSFSITLPSGIYILRDGARVEKLVI